MKQSYVYTMLLECSFLKNKKSPLYQRKIRYIRRCKLSVDELEKNLLDIKQKMVKLKNNKKHEEKFLCEKTQNYSRRNRNLLEIYSPEKIEVKPKSLSRFD